MKLEFLGGAAGAPERPGADRAVSSETDLLTEVLLCPPVHLEPIPCCAATRSSLSDGFAVSVPEATRQHRALQALLAAKGVACRSLSAEPGMPDQCFTRDGAVMTPWGLLGLKPNAPHRRRETAQMLRFARAAGIKLCGTIETGSVEGGDVCIVRDGLLLVGWSGDRTDAAGADALCALFRARGWRAISYRFDPHFLHLDTQFCMVDDGLALACTDVLSDDFIAQIAAEGIAMIPVSYKEAQKLGCNLLALGQKRVIASAGHPRVTQALRTHGVRVETIDISQFERCGGGIHCLTMPLARARSTAASSPAIG